MGRHKRSFQRLPAVSLVPNGGDKQRLVVDTRFLRNQLRQTLSRPAVEAMLAPSSALKIAGPADPWARMFRRATGADAGDSDNADDFDDDVAVGAASALQVTGGDSVIDNTTPAASRGWFHNAQKVTTAKGESPVTAASQAAPTSTSPADDLIDCVAERKAALDLLARMGVSTGGDCDGGDAGGRPESQDARLVGAPLLLGRKARRAAAAQLSPPAGGSWAAALARASERVSAAPTMERSEEAEPSAKQKRKRKRITRPLVAEQTSVPKPARRATKVAAALEQARLGEGRVYFTEPSFDWQALVVNAEAQTWSLHGQSNLMTNDAPKDTVLHTLRQESGTLEAAPPAVIADVGVAKLPDIAALSASFLRPAECERVAARAAWALNRGRLIRATTRSTQRRPH